MKKLAFFLVVIIIIIATISYIYISNVAINNKAKNENIKFEVYDNKVIFGSELITVINKAINSNNHNSVEKDSTGKYIDNSYNSINIDVEFIDNNQVYNCEKLYNNGLDKFLIYYRDIQFKCEEIQYHSNTRMVKYMKFKQILQ